MTAIESPPPGQALCLERWTELYTFPDGTEHSEHLCPKPKGHRDDHSCICEEAPSP